MRQAGVVGYWLFQVNPSRYDALRDLREIGDLEALSVSRHLQDLKAGDHAALWVAGAQAGVYAMGSVTGPVERGMSSEEWIRPEDRGKELTFCPLHFDRILIETPIAKATLAGDPRWSDARVIAQPYAGNPFKLSENEWQAMEDQVSGGRRARDRNPTWALDELILALDLYMRHRPRLLDDGHADVVDLSRLLNELPIHAQRPDAGSFRNPQGVAMKLANFAALDPAYPGKGLTAGGKRDRQVWNLYCNQADVLSSVAETIRTAAARGDLPALPEEDESEVEAEEGALLYRRHRGRERDPRIVSKKKAQVLRDTGKLACEACGFDFEATYGPLGTGFIECHHLSPLADGRRTTRLQDLVLLCSNCHRMAHRRRPWPERGDLPGLVHQP